MCPASKKCHVPAAPLKRFPIIVCVGMATGNMVWSKGALCKTVLLDISYCWRMWEWWQRQPSKPLNTKTLESRECQTSGTAWTQACIIHLGNCVTFSSWKEGDNPVKVNDQPSSYSEVLCFCHAEFCVMCVSWVWTWPCTFVGLVNVCTWVTQRLVWSWTHLTHHLSADKCH